MQSHACIIYLVRHGETDWNKIGRMQGHTDIKLNREGIQQARALKKLLTNVTFDFAYSSDLARAKDTANLLLTDQSTQLKTDPELRERSFGHFEGKSSIDTWNILRPVLDHHDDGHPLLHEKQVETNSHMRQRIVKAILTIASSHTGKTVLVVAHHGVMKQLLIHIGHSKTDHFPKGSIHNLAYIKMQITGNHIEVKDTYGITFNHATMETSL